MQERFKLIILTCVFPLSMFCQQNLDVERSYRKYFDLPRETMFIHTNKTTYLINENIWFKTYVFDKLNKKPSKETTNIHVGLYDSKGNQIFNKLFLGKNGVTSNAIVVDSSFASGTYYLKATTKWMKNFKEDDSYVQEIQILNPKTNFEQKTKVNPKEYDIQLLPEGGHIVRGVRNTLGVKILNDKGVGTEAKGTIYNSKGDQITSFKTNFLGIGKLSFTPNKGENYVAKIILENTKEFDIPITGIKEKGINISVDNLRKNKTIISLRTNSTTLREINNKVYTILIHQNGASSSIPIRFKNNLHRITISKDKLNHGVNTITLFDGKKPILERMFFCQKDSIHEGFSVQKTKKVGDTIFYNIKNQTIPKYLINLSVSVLPRQTKSYSPKHNIKSAFLLKPYLKGEIESPQYYFNKPGDRKREFHLDNLLITQGWSRYNWNNIFYEVPKIKHVFEKGITLNGKINKDLKKVNSLMLFPTLLNKSKLLKISNDGQFSIKNFFPVSDEFLRFTSVHKSGKGRRPRIYVNIPKTTIKDRLSVKENFEYTSYYVNKNEVFPQNFVRDRIEKLDEIVLEARLDRVFKKSGPKFNGSIIKIDDEKVKRYNTIADILETEKFEVKRGNGNIQQTKCSRGDCSNELRDPSPDLSIVSRDKSSNGGPRPVYFFVEGVKVQNLNQFLMTGTLEYEDVYIDYSNNSVESGRNLIREVILVNLFLRRSAFKSADLNNNRYASVKVKNGFEPQKEFYAPGYVSYNIQPFKDYGIVHWEPNVILKKGKDFTLKTVDTGLKELSFFVEGMSSSGKLFSQIIHLEN